MTDLPLPDPSTLTALLSQVTRDWAGLEAQAAEAPALGLAPLPVEFSFKLHGPQPHLLVLRCGQALAEELAEGSTGDPGARELAPWALRELSYRMAETLADRFPDLFRSPSQQLLPVPCSPAEWPRQAPERLSATRVAGQALELRLWALDPDPCLPADRPCCHELTWIRA
jgi:hypothetical protein